MEFIKPLCNHFCTTEPWSLNKLYIYIHYLPKKTSQIWTPNIDWFNRGGFSKKTDLLKYYPVLENRRHFVSMGASLKQVNHTFVGH